MNKIVKKQSELSLINYEGHKVNLSFLNGKWQAIVQENLPAGFTNQVQLPVYLDSAINMEQFFVSAPSFQKQLIHVTFSTTTKEKKGFVYIGHAGLKGGGGGFVADEIGIDISSSNGNIDWNLLTPELSSRKFIIAKATEGRTYQDPKFLAYWRQMSDSGFQAGAYHFLRFGSSTAKEQMDNFLGQLRKAGGWTASSIIALDVEKEERTDLVSSVTEECVTYLEEENITPYIYTTQYFWNRYVSSTPEIIKACPLWIARYKPIAPLPKDLPHGWNKWSIWQYSEKGSVPGIAGYVDSDVKIN